MPERGSDFRDLPEGHISPGIRGLVHLGQGSLWAGQAGFQGAPTQDVALGLGFALEFVGH